ncbi:MAG: hypothetical protein HRU38_04520 [Saccharospirillaceae bacterium]|nr:hypothetical protein [Pseudomonadales bacterium]NRB77923.1 hypothetical protein [Saccharospirillaceae bacterium]
MFTKVFIFNLFLIFSFFSISTPVIFLPESEGGFEEGGTGKYDKIFNTIHSYGTIEWELIHLPYKRAIKLFLGSKDACLAIGNTQVALEYFNIEVIDPGIGYTSNQLVFATDVNQKVISSQDDLIDKIIVHIIGESPEIYGFNINEIRTDSVRNHSQSLKMLHANRIDVIFGITSDFDNIDFNYHFDKNFVVLDNYDSIICKKTIENVKFLEIFRQALIKYQL